MEAKNISSKNDDAARKDKGFAAKITEAADQAGSVVMNAQDEGRGDGRRGRTPTARECDEARPHRSRRSP